MSEKDRKIDIDTERERVCERGGERDEKRKRIHIAMKRVSERRRHRLSQRADRDKPFANQE